MYLYTNCKFSLIKKYVSDNVTIPMFSLMFKTVSKKCCSTFFLWFYHHK